MFDVIVIGAGSGGLTSALGLAGLNKKVLLIEKHKMGGDCTNYGCIPSKSLIKYGKEAAILQKHGYKLDNELGAKSLKGTRSKVAEVLSHESPELLMGKYKTLTVVMGEAKFVDKQCISVDNKEYKGKKFVIATGSEPRSIKIKGLDDKYILTNKSVFDLNDVPKKLIIIGGGVIACELGEAFANLGSKVSLIVRGERLLSRNEPEISDYVFKKLALKGVEVYFESSIDKVIENKAYIGDDTLKFDKILMAIGRVVNLKNLRLANADVKYDKNGIETNDKNKTSTSNIYAVGDVSSRDKLTHNADHQGRNVVKDILLPYYRNKKKTLPKVIYMEDEVASIGLNYNEACLRHSKAEIFKISLDFDRVDRALTDETSGKFLLIVKGLTGKIVGASIVGPHAGEMIATIGVAMDNKINLHKLSASIYAYPTYSRIFKKAGDDFLRTISTKWKSYLKFCVKSKGPKLFFGLFWISLIIGFFQYKSAFEKTNLEIAKDFFSYFTEPDFRVALIYIAVYALRPLILFPATLLTVLSGALFGPIYGSIYTIIGANLSANVAYSMGRFLGADFVNEDSSGIINTWKNKLKERSFETVLIMRLIYLPFDAVNYGCGILKVKWAQYLLATLIGTIPGSITFVVFGSSINFADFDTSEISLEPKLLITSIVLFLISLVIAKLVRNKEKNK
jgi:pyruvate/2-oxoglutarate dehydrogenase complex dihydrolipoamide dehydrogenase (E3) component/uncharacterized membrane protein YdjX (TVP38/TMEM64 family)